MMMRFESASIIAITCSATPSLLPPAWFTTATPAAVASFRLTVSNPAPFVDSTSKFGHRFSSAAWPWSFGHQFLPA